MFFFVKAMFCRGIFMDDIDMDGVVAWLSGKLSPCCLELVQLGLQTGKGVKTFARWNKQARLHHPRDKLMADFFISSLSMTVHII